MGGFRRCPKFFNPRQGTAGPLPQNHRRHAVSSGSSEADPPDRVLTDGWRILHSYRWLRALRVAVEAVRDFRSPTDLVIKKGRGNMNEEDWGRVIRDAIAQSIWKTPPVEEEPVIRLTNWQVFEVTGELRLVGYHGAGGEGRLSTPIQTIESRGLRAVTRSGRVYVLNGPAGSHPDGDWVLDRWLNAQGKKRTDIQILPLEEVLRRLADQGEKEG